jgi:hypothetical protein
MKQNSELPPHLPRGLSPKQAMALRGLPWPRPLQPSQQRPGPRLSENGGWAATRTPNYLQLSSLGTSTLRTAHWGHAAAMPDDRRGVPATTSTLSSRPATTKNVRYTGPRTMRSHASSMSVSGEARSCPRFVCSVACEQLGPVVHICRRLGRWKAASGRCLIASLHRCTATAEPAVHAPGSTWVREAFCTTARIECGLLDTDLVRLLRVRW